jgi:hypothetical protein
LAGVPNNITPISMPSRAPELNPVENIWQYLRANWLSNLVFDTYDEIIDAASEAWRKLIAQHKPSPQSECAKGLKSVRTHDSWYYPRVAYPSMGKASIIRSHTVSIKTHQSRVCSSLTESRKSAAIPTGKGRFAGP